MIRLLFVSLFSFVLCSLSFAVDYLATDGLRNSAGLLTGTPNTKIRTKEGFSNQYQTFVTPYNKATTTPVTGRSLRYGKQEQVSDEYILYRRLLNLGGYQRHLRPVQDHRVPVIVKVGMCLIMVEEIIEKDQTLAMAVCLKLKWRDQYLRWNPNDYNNLTWMSVPSSSIWVPDIAIINSPEPYLLTRKQTNVELTHTGEIGFYPSGKLVTRCSIQIKYFPLDWQRCDVRLESWIYPIGHLRLEMISEHESVDMKEYYANHEWAVEGYDIIPELASYDNKNFSTITFAFVLRRKPMYYVFYFILPQLLLALMQTLSSTLPVEHPGRMAMLTSLFIGTSVTQAGIADLIPKSSDSMSLLQIYMSIMICNIAVSIIVTCLTMYSVLRYPNEEPSLTAILVAFFTIAWPRRDDQYKTSNSERIESMRNTQAFYNGMHGYHSDNGTIPEEYEVDTSKVRKVYSPKLSSTSSRDLTSKRKASVRTKRFLFGRRVGSFDSDDSSRFKDHFAHTSWPVANYNATDLRETARRSLPEEDRRIPHVLVRCEEGAEVVRKNGISRPQHLLVPGQLFFYDSAADEVTKSYVTIQPQNNHNHSKSSDHQSVQSPRSKRGEASICDETRDLKRRWLLYCVALDKTFMYVSLVWNIVVPIVLFGIVPELAPRPVVQHNKYY